MRAQCTSPQCTQTHEQFIAAVAQLAMAGLAPTERAKLDGIKLVYGAGPAGVRGVTYYNRWKGAGTDTSVRPFVEISAFTQESWLQIAGTTIHELGHVLAGWEAGHGPDWHKACEALGLRKIKAGGTAYKFANFQPALREAIAALPRPDDGAPVANLLGAGFAGAFGPRGGALKGCQAGIGTRGGKSRGAGSGSRLRLFECDCPAPVKVRVARDEFHAHCDTCTHAFHFVK